MNAILLLFLSVMPAQPMGKCVLDETNTLTPGQFASLEQSCEAMDRSGDGQFEVVLTNDFRGEEKEEFTNQLFTNWKIGHKGKNDGVLIVVSPKLHKWRIEVGYGLEGRITDIQASHIGTEYGVPFWKRGDFGQGLIEVVAQIAPMMHAEAKVAAPVVTQHSDVDEGLLILLFIVLGIGFAVGLAYWLSRKEKKSEYVPPRYVAPPHPYNDPSAKRSDPVTRYPAPVTTTVVVPVVVESSKPKRRDDTPPSSSSSSNYDYGSSSGSYDSGSGGGFDGGGGGMSGGGGAGGDF